MTRLSAEDGATRDPIERLAEEFLDRFRRGERPSLSEYEQAHPDLAEGIRDFFPALVELEALKPGGGLGEATGSFASGRSSPRGRLPDRLGDYQILSEIGRGGMGIVYEAVRESLKSRVALKVMNPRHNERDRERFALRFKSEARAAASLHHTNIVGVFDYGEHGGHCYYAMQFIAGHGLDRILDDVRRLRLEESRKAERDAQRDREPIGEQATIGGSGAWQIGDSEGPLLGAPTRMMTKGLISGQFGRPVDATAPTRAVDGDLSPDLPPVPPPSPPGGAGPSGSVDDLGLSSSSLAAKTEIRYFREVARLGAQVADALGHAHRRGVIHRDIKPSNLLLDALGNVWVTDFGLAKLEEGDDLSNSRDVVGTLRYMAPERFRGVSDRRCDTYALGASLYEMLTLRPAFEAPDQIQLIDRIVNEPPTPLRQFDRQIPRDFETIVLKALAKDPADRFASAEEMAAELRRFVEQRPIKSRSVPAYERLWRWCKRNPGLAAANAAAAALTVTLAIVATLSAYKFREQRNDLADEQRKLSAEQKVTKASLIRARDAEREASSALAQSRQAEGRSLQAEGAALLRTGLKGQRFEALDRLTRSAGLLLDDAERKTRRPLLRDQAMLALCRPDIRTALRFELGAVMARGAGFDRTSGLAAIVDRDGLLIYRIDGQGERIRLPGPTDAGGVNAAAVVFSPGGAIACASYEMNAGGLTRVHVWDLRTRERLAIVLSVHTPLVFHPDGRHFFFTADEGNVGVWDVAERRESRRIPIAFHPYQLAMAPDGRRLAVGSMDWTAPRVAIVDVESGRTLSIWDKGVANGAMAWSSDGRLLAIGGTNPEPRGHVWDIERGARITTLEGHALSTISAWFLPGTYRLVTSSWDSTSRLWDAISGEQLLEVSQIGDISTDGRHAVGWEVGASLFLEFATGEECRVLHPGLIGNRLEDRGTYPGVAAEFAPDGRLLATADSQGIRLWDAETGVELAQLEAGPCESVTFEAGGEAVIGSSDRGVFRWPFRPDRGTVAGPGRPVVAGPPELIREPTIETRLVTWLPGRRTLAVLDRSGSMVHFLDLARPRPYLARVRSLSSISNPRMTDLSVSPDGRWMAAGAWKEAGVTLWDLQASRVVRILASPEAPSEQNVRYFASFSPDGRWLSSLALHGTSGRNSYLFWKVGSWELGYRIEAESQAEANTNVAFSEDGRLMALRIARDQVLLADPADGREIARLTTPRAVKPAPLAFSPDGTKLVASTNQKTLLIWDLRAIRAGLARAALDWDWPAFPDARPTPAPGPIRVEGRALQVGPRRAAERLDFERKLAADPSDVDAQAGLGWLASKEGRLRDAIDHLDRAVRLSPDDIDVLNLLVATQERAGDLAGAIATLDRALAVAPDDVPFRLNRGILAMILGRAATALGDFDRCVALQPDSDSYRYRRATALLRLGRAGEALADADRLAAKYPRDFGIFDLRGRLREAAGDIEGASADRREAVRLTTGNANALNSRAWPLVAGPPSRRDPDLAVTLASRAVELDGDNPLYLNTYGVALCRAWRFGEAVPILERSLVASAGKTDGFDLLFLALAHHHLGHPRLARDCLDRALRWRADHRDLSGRWNAELDEFEAEARALIEPPASELPADVFAPD